MLSSEKTTTRDDIFVNDVFLAEIVSIVVLIRSELCQLSVKYMVSQWFLCNVSRSRDICNKIIPTKLIYIDREMIEE